MIRCRRMVAAAPHGRSSNEKSSTSDGQLPSLTSLRGVAALWVVLYHYSVQYFPNLNAAQYTQLLGKGYLAVDMFFMLSGFVMTHVYHKVFSESVTDHYRNFLVARIARLYPLHIFILFLFVATALASSLMVAATTGSLQTIPLKGPESFSAIIANIFMLQGLEAGKLSWNYPAWSISVEFIAYLAFPFALPAIWRASDGTKVALALFLVLALVCLAFLTRDNFDQWDGPITLLRCLPEFLLGTLLYYVFRRSTRGSWLKGDAAAFAIATVIILCLHFGTPDLLIVLLFAGLILVAVGNAGVFARLVNIGPLIWLGEISYSLYLIHGFVEFVATKMFRVFAVQDRSDLPRGDALGLMLLMVGVCLFSATATYFGVEVVWRRHLREMLRLRRSNRSGRVLSSSQA